MAFDHEKREARRMLGALEDGTLSTADARDLFERADPALVYLLVGWLRARYGAGHSASEGVLGRIVALMRESAVTAKAVKAGEADAISRWFEETHDYRSVERDDFVDLIVEKLEG